MTAGSVEHEVDDALLDGEQRVLEQSASGAPLALDALEPRHSEEALRKSDDVLRMVIDTIPTMAWSVPS
jgi:hypothetical protein